jgi:hypothetical protein
LHLPSALPDKCYHRDVNLSAPYEHRQQCTFAGACSGKDTDALPFPARQQGIDRPYTDRKNLIYATPG